MQSGKERERRKKIEKDTALTENHEGSSRFLIIVNRR